MNNSKPLVTLLAAMVVGFVAVGIVGYHTLKSSLIETKKKDIEILLNIARSQSSHYIDQYQQGILTKEQTEEKIVYFLSALRFEAAYVWANDNNGIGRVHPREGVIGEFQSSYPNHMANLVDRDIFFLTKSNVKPLTNELIVKTNGVVKMPQWDWVIGLGLYLDDINGMMFGLAKTFIGVLLSSVVLCFMVTYYWLRKIR